MHTQFLGAVFLALCLARGVLSAPLELTHKPVTQWNGRPDQEEADNLGRLKAAEKDANRHILKMEHVLKNPADAKNAELIHAAFGKNAQTDKIKNTVQKLKTGKMPVSLDTQFDQDSAAEIKYDDTKSPAIPQHAEFGWHFHQSSKATPNMRAATLVHEASHYLANTGDTLDRNNKIIPANDNKTPENGRDGYTSSYEPPKTVAQLNTDRAWKINRDGAPGLPPIVDMHNNADSYAVFGSLCDAAVSNAAAGIRRRAMLERDWHTAAVHLVRRQACAMRKPKSAAKTTAAAAKNAKLTPAAKAKLAAASKLTPKKPVGAAATAAGKKTATKASLLKGGLTKTPLSKTAAKSKALASSKLGKSRSPLSKIVVTKKTTVSKESPLSSKLAVNSLTKKPASLKANAGKVVPKTAVRKPIANKAVSKPATVKGAVRKPVAPVAKPAAAKPVTAKATPKPVAAKTAPKKVRREYNF